MKNIETHITIKSSINKVWDILTTFEKYSDWNPFLIQIEKISPQKLKVTTNIKGKKTSFFPKLVCKDKPFELRWIGQLAHVSWLFQGEHYFILKSVSTKETLLTHGENFSGLLVILGWNFLRPKIYEEFSRMNLALKKACEKE